MTQAINLGTHPSQSAFDRLKVSVVKLYITNLIENHHQPWSAPSMQKITASGFIIAQQRLVTNAHAVPKPVVIQVEMAHKSHHYRAQLEAIRYGDDLALLTVDHPEFWQETKPLDLIDVLTIDTRLKVVGFPGTGGLTITRGNICRVLSAGVNSYGSPQSLIIQSNAAINPGNSGGPAVNDDNQVLGVCYACETLSNQVGYIIPTEVLRRFLEEIADTGTCRQIYEVGLKHQCLINSQVRGFLGMSAHQSGVRIVSVSPLSPFKDVLMPHDVLMQINHYPIRNDGNIDYRGNIIAFDYIFASLKSQDTVALQVLRGGRLLRIETRYQIPQVSDKLVDIILPSETSSYIISSGMAFRPCRISPAEAQSVWSHIYLSLKRREPKQNPDDQVVVMQQVFETASTFGQQTDVAIVKRINGKTVRHIRDVKDALDENEKSEHEISTEDDYLLILKNIDPQQHLQALNQLGIQSDCSADLQAKPLLFTARSPDAVMARTGTELSRKRRTRSNSLI